MAMSRTVYVNGHYVGEEEATVSIFDRGFIFGDGVYEVTAVLDGKLVDFEAHMARLARSLAELGIVSPLTERHIRDLHETLIARNGVDEGIVYLEITRGAGDRDFAPSAPLTPTVVAFTQARALLDNPHAVTGVTVITVPDIRWKRRDIKSISLVGQVMGKRIAKEQGAYEAWLVENSVVTEGTSSTAWIVDANGTIRTQPLGYHILAGVTRRALLQLAEQDGIAILERPFSVSEALAAREAFLTSASTFVLPIVEIDGHAIGDGRPGPVARRFRELYLENARA